MMPVQYNSAVVLLRLIGERVMSARQASRLTHAELADHARVPVNQLAQLEQGRRSIDIDQLYRIAVVLDVPPSDLVPTEAEISAGVLAATEQASRP